MKIVSKFLFTYNSLGSQLGRESLQKMNEPNPTFSLVDVVSWLKISTANKITTIEQEFDSTLRTKGVVETMDTYDKFPVLSSVPPKLKMDFSRILNKPFFIETFNWRTSDSALTYPYYIDLPNDILSNYLATVPFISSSLYRMRLCVLLQVAGTPMHSGTLLASALPYEYAPYILSGNSPNQLLSAPHSFLYANESTPACIEVPFYARAPLARCMIGQSPVATNALSLKNYSRVQVLVLNPLQAPTSGSTTLSVSVHVVVRDVEFYVPRNSNLTWIAASADVGPLDMQAIESAYPRIEEIKDTPSNMPGWLSGLKKIPTRLFDAAAYGTKLIAGDFIDGLRSALRIYTGFHNPNDPVIHERMIFSKRNFGNNVDQPNLIEKMDQHAQFDRVCDDYIYNTAVDEMDLSYILKKPAYQATIQVNSSDISGTMLYSNPITPMLETVSTTYFSPMRKFYEASRYWRGSLRMHIQSSMSNFHYCKLLVVKNYDSDPNCLTFYPSMDGVHNLLTDTLEFSAGGQVHTIDLPYCSQLEQLECTKDYSANALMHGMVYIYLLQPLVVNGTVPLSVNFNIYYTAGDDFQFYGYATDLMSTPATFLENDQPVDLVEKDNRKFETHANFTTVGISSQDAVNNSEEETRIKELRSRDYKPMVNLRDYIRRMNYTYYYSVAQSDYLINSGLIIVPISKLLDPISSGSPMSVILPQMYLGMRGGLKIKALTSGNAVNNIKRMFYIPPGTIFNGNNTGLIPTDPGDWQWNDYFYNRNQLFPGASVLSASCMNQELAQHVENNVYPTSLFEFVIPNMNPFRFINYLNLSRGIQSMDADMGYIVFQGTELSVTSTALVIQFLVAFTDETRFGFHVMAPPATLITSSNGYYRDSVFNNSVGSNPIYGNLIDRSVARGAYIVKSA